MNSRERLTAIFKREPVDRVPVSLYEFHGFYDSWIRDYPEYAAILDYAADKTDELHMWYAPKAPDETVLFKGLVDPDMVRTETWKERISTFTRQTIRTPEGDLTTLSREEEGMHTAWCLEHLCKSPADARKLLSLPFIPWKPSVESFFELDRQLGDRGIVMGDMADTLAATVDLFGFSDFLMLYLDEKPLIDELMAFFHERVMTWLEHLLKSGAVTVYRICGAEYATPPYMSPADFDKLVTPYVSDFVDLLHRYGGYARLHAHGRVRKALESFKAMGIDATDPLEPPPDGDIELDEVRAILGDDVILIGNIEERIFEIGTKAEVETAVRDAIERTEGKGLILCPTAMPLTTPLDPKIAANVVHYIDCGEKYGNL